MRITYRGINIEYNPKNRGFFWHSGSATDITQLKAQIDYWLKTNGLDVFKEAWHPFANGG